VTGLQFVAAIVNSLAWPAAVTVAAVLLRKEIRDALRRMLHLRFPGGEASFAAVAPIQAALAATAGKADEPVDTAEVRRQATQFGPLEDLAEWAPAQAIVYAWGLLEYQLNAASDRIAPNQPHGWPQVAVNLRRLDKWPLLFPAIAELQRLRDYTVESGYPPSTADAIRYVSLAQDLVTTLRTAAVSRAGDGSRAGDDEDDGKMMAVTHDRHS
jgi:hypothetical protein